MDIDKLKTLSVLYIEDELELQTVTYNFLEDFLGKIVVASNGEEALIIFEQEEFDLIITDINMPKLDGLEMMKLMKKKKPDIKVIVTTAYNHKEKIDEFFDAGMNEYIMKPIDFTKLMKTIIKISF